MKTPPAQAAALWRAAWSEAYLEGMKTGLGKKTRR